ncbi:MAG: CoxG family protein [Candidatus Limnocylindria bacterium]
MKLDGSIDIAAPADAVWAVLVDPTDLAACVPGVSAVRQVDPTTFEGTVRASVGPLDGDFSFRSVTTRADFPADLVVDVEGTDSITRSRVLAHVEAALTETASGTTLTYRATVTTKGRLAIIGDMVLRATAGVMIGQVTRCLRDRLEAAPR